MNTSLSNAYTYSRNFSKINAFATFFFPLFTCCYSTADWKLLFAISQSQNTLRLHLKIFNWSGDICAVSRVEIFTLSGDIYAVSRLEIFTLSGHIYAVSRLEIFTLSSHIYAVSHLEIFTLSGHI